MRIKDIDPTTFQALSRDVKVKPLGPFFGPNIVDHDIRKYCHDEYSEHQSFNNLTANLKLLKP